MIKPLYDRILLEAIQEEAITHSGILLPESKDKPTVARVVAVGESTDKESPTLIKVGDHVVYKKYSTTEIKYQNQDYLIIESKDILAIVEEDK
ncbi:co-chaperone GroES [Erysipelothrix sp. HDW6B]|uniref:co-chaperone GroES n=1 Tax=Erysipelothrix sp. HDW6B TaxID=2714929 RepID=UPI00140A0A6A|nr:co-chaperone GroES [Erysipelothrix sp. HDW6B]QIK86647.1 co-chaperone GroES [Erysipelothrix sp. HDW6B]